MRTSGGIAITLGLALVLPALAGTTVASHEEGDCEVTSSPTLVDAGGFALVSHEVEATVAGQGPGPLLGGAGLYLEDNGLPGIQRADAFNEDENCGHGPDVKLVAAGCQGSVTVGPDEIGNDLQCAG